MNNRGKWAPKQCFSRREQNGECAHSAASVSKKWTSELKIGVELRDWEFHGEFPNVNTLRGQETVVGYAREGNMRRAAG